MADDPQVLLTKSEKRSLGAYYTPGNTVRLMTEWVVSHKPRSILEPSFGDGAFLMAIEAAVKSRRSKPSLIGAELLPAAFEAANSRMSIDVRGHAGDFLGLQPEPVDAVIGNPPFVRLRHISPEQRKTALDAARVAMGREMDPSGSTWMPFVLHASTFLNPGGSLALVLPNELTYVRYARPLWTFLGQNFGRIRVVRSYERIFEDLLQDVVILLADEKGKSSEHVEFQVSDSLQSLNDEDATRRLSITSLASGDRGFHRALLPPRVIKLVEKKLEKVTIPVADVAKIRIGYVAGDKNFFHPDARQQSAFALPGRSLRPSFGPGRTLRGHGLLSSALPHDAQQFLWHPDPSKLTKGERSYIEEGEETKVSEGYKCSIRSPWYLVPGVEVPDAVFAVFNDRPLMLINDAGLVASNSLLCATMKPGKTTGWLAAAWYNSITRLFVELEIHSLGGGVLVAVPQELSRVRVPHSIPASKKHLAAINDALAADDFEAACSIGDRALVETGAISKPDLALIKEGILTLKCWRTRSTN